MRTFGIISTSIWRSKRFRSLENHIARLTYLYLHTTSSGSSAGAFVLPPEMAALEMRISDVENIRQAFRDLSEVGLIRYDEDEEFIFLVGFYRFNRLSSRKHLAGPLKMLRDVLPDSPIRAFAAAELVVALYERAKEWGPGVDAAGVFLQEAQNLVKEFNLIDVLSSEEMDLSDALKIGLSEALLIDLSIGLSAKDKEKSNGKGNGKGKSNGNGKDNGNGTGKGPEPKDDIQDGIRSLNKAARGQA